MGSAYFIIGNEEGLSSDHGLDDVIFDLTPVKIGLETFIFEGAKELSK